VIFEERKGGNITRTIVYGWNLSSEGAERTRSEGKPFNNGAVNPARGERGEEKDKKLGMSFYY